MQERGRLTDREEEEREERENKREGDGATLLVDRYNINCDRNISLAV